MTPWIVTSTATGTPPGTFVDHGVSKDGRYGGQPPIGKLSASVRSSGLNSSIGHGTKTMLPIASGRAIEAVGPGIPTTPKIAKLDGPLFGGVETAKVSVWPIAAWTRREK